MAKAPKSTELGIFWMRQRAADLRADAAKMRAAYRTPFMMEQCDAAACAYEDAADLLCEAADRRKRQQAQPHGGGEGG